MHLYCTFAIVWFGRPSFVCNHLRDTAQSTLVSNSCYSCFTMADQTKLPRRALQRRGIRSRTTVSGPQVAEGADCSSAVLIQSQCLSSTTLSPNQTDGSTNAVHNSRSDIPKTAVTKPSKLIRKAPKGLEPDIVSDSVGESEEDSGYCSLEEDELYDRFLAEGPAIANHADSTKAFIGKEEEKWIKYFNSPWERLFPTANIVLRFCERRSKDPTEELCRCDAALFKVYLDYRVKSSRIKKQSAITAYWKVLSMIYAKEAKEYMNDRILFDMRNVSQRYLRLSFVTNTASGFLPTLLQNTAWKQEQRKSRESI